MLRIRAAIGYACRMKSKYVDGFLVVVAKKKLADYVTLAKKAGRVWKAHGALGFYECVGDDHPKGGGMPFPKRAKCKSTETVLFSFVTFKSKAHRDAVNTAVMADKRMAKLADGPMPFDIKKMSYGGFQVVVGL